MSRLASRLSHALLAVSFLAIPGCVQKFGPIVTRPATLGEELLSLDAAHKEGLLTDEEFATRRARTIAMWKAIGTAPVAIPEVDDAP